jgi:hypothetical protein
VNRAPGDVLKTLCFLCNLRMGQKARIFVTGKLLQPCEVKPWLIGLNHKLRRKLSVVNIVPYLLNGTNSSTPTKELRDLSVELFGKRIGGFIFGTVGNR